MPTEPPPNQVAGTAAFSKFVHLVQLTADASAPLTIAELSKMSGYPRGTVYRIVAALVAERLLAEKPGTDKLVLGPRLINWAGRSWDRSELRQAAIEKLKWLRDATGETVHLATPNGEHMVYIEKLESPSAVRMNSRVGSNVWMHATAVGKAWLASLSENEQNNVLRKLPQPLPKCMPKTVSDLDSLRKELERTRKRGWALDDEESEAGICCFAAPIFGEGNVPIAAISVSTLRFRQKPDLEQAYILPLLNACGAISQRIVNAPSTSANDIF